MNKNQIALSSLAMDLKRVALGYHRGLITTANRFLEEAFKRKKEVDTSMVKPYVKKILDNVEMLGSKSPRDIAEDALMFSTLLQNAVLSQKQ